MAEFKIQNFQYDFKQKQILINCSKNEANHFSSVSVVCPMPDKSWQGEAELEKLAREEVKRVLQEAGQSL